MRLTLPLFLLVGLLVCLLPGCKEEVPTLSRDPAEVARVIAAVEAAAADKDAYRAALLENERTTYNDYLRRFPEGAFRAEVEQHLNNLDNRAAQARYAYDLVIRTLKSTSVPSRISSKLFGNYRPSIIATLDRTEATFRKELARLETTAPDQLPNTYLDYLDRQLSNGSLYTAETKRQYERYRKRLLAATPKIHPWIQNPLRSAAEDHLRKCRKITSAAEANFAAQGRKARQGIGQYRVN